MLYLVHECKRYGTCYNRCMSVKGMAHAIIGA